MIVEMSHADNQLLLDELASVVERFARVDGDHRTNIPALTLHRWTTPREPVICIYEPCLAIAARGTKRAILAGREYIYDATRAVVASVDLPVGSQVMQATADCPYLGIMLRLHTGRVAELIADMGSTVAASSSFGPGLISAALSNELLDAVVRLVKLTNKPDDIAIMAPLFEREILYRLLRTELGAHLRHLASAASRSSHILRVIEWIKLHYDRPLRIEQLALRANMSASAFHHHFKAITAMTPLQYQKQLRLQEARRLMLAERLDAASASQHVGYESPSQFNREYRRLYGMPPHQDIARLRKAAPLPA